MCVSVCQSPCVANLTSVLGDACPCQRPRFLSNLTPNTEIKNKSEFCGVSRCRRCAWAIQCARPPTQFCRFCVLCNPGVAVLGPESDERAREGEGEQGGGGRGKRAGEEARGSKGRRMGGAREGGSKGTGKTRSEREGGQAGRQEGRMDGGERAR
jgi:hypothetical protein